MKSQSPTKKKSPQSRRGLLKPLSVGGSLPPYGVPIREAIAGGNVQEMRRVAASTRKWLKDVQVALDRMEKSMRDLEG